MSDQSRALGDIDIPTVGFGTYLIPGEEAEGVVAAAFAAGYRHIDTAEAYGNESGIGAAIRAFLDSGESSRTDLFVTTKLYPGNAAWGQEEKTYESTIESLDASLASLGLEFVDLYLIHAPLAVEQRVEQWRALVHLREQGKTRAIGVSNYNAYHIEQIKEAGLPLPDADQIELHPWSQKTELVTYLRDYGILPMAYSSLVPLSTWRTAEGHDSAKTDAMRADANRDDSPFRTMGTKYGVSEAQILLRWGVQNGYVVIPKSTNPTRMRENLDVFSFSLDDRDMDLIATMDRGGGVAWATGDPTQMP
jgi:2,5-diketo-D-gluconate reductase A